MAFTVPADSFDFISERLELQGKIAKADERAEWYRAQLEQLQDVAAWLKKNGGDPRRSAPKNDTQMARLYELEKQNSSLTFEVDRLTEKVQAHAEWRKQMRAKLRVLADAV